MKKRMYIIPHEILATQTIDGYFLLFYKFVPDYRSHKAEGSAYHKGKGVASTRFIVLKNGKKLWVYREDLKKHSK